MSDFRSELVSKWREADLTQHGGHEWRAIALSVQAPIKLLAGIREPDGRIALLLEAPIASAPRAVLRLNAEGLSLADQRRPDEGIYRVAIALEQQHLRDVFEVLAADIVETAEASQSTPGAILAITRRLETWQACLRVRRQGLTREEQTGLMGELTVLRLISQQIGYIHSVDAWEGPLDGLHDFTSRGISLEVKSSLGNSDRFQVSHFAQLDTSGLATLLIARVYFREGSDGKSISAEIAEVREEIRQNAPHVLPAFNERLLRVGYLDVDQEIYSRLRFKLLEVFGIEVRDDFPRLTVSSVPVGIIDGSYVVDERMVASFRVSSGRFDEIVSKMSGDAT